MLGLLPLIAFLALFVFIGNHYTNWGWRKSFLRSILLSGSYVVLLTEALSIFRGINRAILTISWLVPFFLFAGWMVKRVRNGESIQLPVISIPQGLFQRALLIFIFIVLLLTAFIAWTWQLNTWDSLRYHMPRVAHWSQLKSVQHYATGIEVQNGIGPFAEYAILHTYVLSGVDRWANFIEWIAMVASLVGGSYLARQLGGGKTSQALTVAIMVSLPMGIAQATSTMTDYVVSFFLLATAIEAVSIHQGERDPLTFVFLGLSVGLAIGVKPTAYAYLLPFAFYIVIIMISQMKFSRIFKYSVLVLLIVVVLNAGQFIRNIETYDYPIGAPSLAAEQSNELKTFRGLISNIVRHASLHAGTPWETVNAFVYKGIIKIHLLVDLAMDDPRTTSIGPFMFWPPRKEESFAGNSLHAYSFILISILAFIFFRKFSPRLFIFMFVMISTFVVFCFVFKWQVFSSRYHLPFFVLFAPVAGVCLEGILPKKLNFLLGIGFIILAWPWLLNLENRPLIAYVSTLQSSSFTQIIRKVSYPGQREYDAYKAITDKIVDANCSTVAIMISGNGTEYPFWANLGAPRDDLEIQWVVVGTPSDKYMDESFEPCAAICQYCPKEWTTFRDLMLVYEDHNHQLFLKEQ